MRKSRKLSAVTALGSLTAAVALLAGSPASAQTAPGGGSFPGSFLVPGTNTSIKIGGFAKVVGIYDIGRVNGDTTQIGSIPLAAGTQTHAVRLHARQSNINIDTRTPTAYGDLTTFVLFDAFGQNVTGAENASNTQNVRLVYAYGTLGPFLAGQWVSLWADTDAIAESVDPTPTVGVMNGTTNRAPQFRYTFAAPGGFSAAVSIENPEAEGTTGATFTTASAGAIAGNVDKYPDILARARLDGPWGHAALTGMYRDMKLDSPAVAHVQKSGYGIEASGHINTFGKDALKAIAVYGKGLGHYVTDLGATAGIQEVSLATGAAASVPWVYGISVGYTHWWTGALRSSLQAGYDHVNNNTASAALAAGEEKRHMVGIVNLIWSPVPQVDLGIEYEQGRRTIQTGTSGNLSRVEVESVFKF